MILLTTTKDVKNTRENMLESQRNQDALTGLTLELKGSVLDHDHKSQRVRGVIDRQVNAYLGRIENQFLRHMSWWYPQGLPTFLRQAAYYLEQDYSHNPYHPGWIKRCMIEFRKLNGTQQKKLLKAFFVEDAPNSTGRQKNFEKLLKSRAVTYGEVLEELTTIKENNI